MFSCVHFPFFHRWRVELLTSAEGGLFPVLVLVTNVRLRSLSEKPVNIANPFGIVHM